VSKFVHDKNLDRGSPLLRAASLCIA
jgi:hypothetical protein